MKKIIPFFLVLALSFYFFVPVSVKADGNIYSQFNSIVILPYATNDNPPLVTVFVCQSMTLKIRNGWLEVYDNPGLLRVYHYFNSVDEAVYAIENGIDYGFIDQAAYQPFIFYRGSYNLIGNNDDTVIYDTINDWYGDEPEPPEPEPGSSWLGDLWEWVLWQLGINDDYSGDIDVYITGGDRERMEMVTPSPTPSPTPVPSPTPYTLNIIDNNGNPVYTITGIPGSTYNITNNTNNNDGSDFDIFEVDMKIGDGGSVNPRDGLNEIMDTSLSYLSDPENVDMQPVGDSFSIIPNDWFLILGVVACFPFIAGFISKLLK